MTPQISVVVPTYRRVALLERCLAALAEQTLAKSEYEIVVVHDGPGADARHAVARYVARSGVAARFFELGARRGPAAARNRGWHEAKAPIIAFTDDDTVPARTWLAEAVAAMQPGVDAGWGRLVMPIGHAPTDYELDAAALASAPFVTANCFCRREVLERLGGFDERFERAWREDSDLHFRLLRSGARIVHAASAVVEHPIRPAQWGVSLRQQSKILFDALLYKKHRELYRERIRRRPRWDYYAAVGALFASLTALAYGATAAATAAVAIWVLLTARFCAARLLRASKAPAHVAEMIVTSAIIPPLAVFWRFLGAIRYRVVFL
jgi:GT2 family glycosyltransferase